jgi:hypothetical protein
MASLYRRMFELDPINNINSFSSENGVDVINFIIPPIPGALLATGDMVLQGNLQLNVDASNPKERSDNYTPGIDNVLGLHGCIERVEITSRNGNVLLEQRLSYGLGAKLGRANISNEDLRGGRFNCQNLSGENVAAAAKFLNRDAFDGDGAPFNIQLQTGLLADNLQRINLGAVGGIEIKITLASTANFLFEQDNDNTDKLTSASVFNLRKLKLFGRYQYVEQSVADAMKGIEFKQMSNQLQVIQSSNDTLAFQPQVASLDKIVYVFQPNSTTKNNFATNNYQVNNLVGMKEYRVSRNGSLFPMDFSVVNNTAVPDLPEPVNEKHIQAGNAEQAYHLILGINGIYPPIHSLVSGVNQARANADLSGVLSTDPDETTNKFCNNIDCAATSYQYGFANFATPMVNDLLQVQFNSSVKTADSIVSSAVRDQTQTTNTLMIYNTTLNYANLQVSK